MEQPTPKPGDASLDLARNRTSFATYRTQLALDRTTLAWIRTTLTMASFGFGMVSFFRSREHGSPGAETIRFHQGAVRFGVALIVLGIVATLLASGSHGFTLRRLRLRGSLTLSRWPLSITVATLFAIVGDGTF